MTITTTSFSATFRYATGETAHLQWDPTSGGPDVTVTLSGATFIVPRRFLPALHDLTGDMLDAAMARCA